MSVDEMYRRVEGSIDLENIVIDLQKGSMYLGVGHTCGVAQHTHPCLGIILVTKSDGAVDDFRKARVKGGFTIASESDDIDITAFSHFFLEFCLEFLHHRISIGEMSSLMVLVPSALAVDAVEGAYLGILGQKVHAKADTQSATMDRTDDIVVINIRFTFLHH